MRPIQREGLSPARIMTAAAIAAFIALTPSSGTAQTKTKLDTTQFVVVGEGIAAGMADFSLREIYQDFNFGAQMARQMKTAFPQPLFQQGGIGAAPGFPVLPPRLPNTLQGSVRSQFPPQLFVFNISVPGMTVADSLTLRPTPPVVHHGNVKQSTVNMILGYPALIAGVGKPLWTQVEYASKLNPTFMIVELGFYEVLEPAVLNDPSKLPDITVFRNNLATLFSRLNSTSPQILAMTIPDPFDTGYFTPLAGVTRMTGVSADTLTSVFGLRADDLVTPNGLMIIGNSTITSNAKLYLGSQFSTLAASYPGSVVSAATRTAVQARLTQMNTELTTAAKAVGAQTYDLQGLYRTLRAQGLAVGSRRLTADYLGGIYSLDGYYPGVTTHAVIANELLGFLNRTYGQSFALLDMTKVIPDDPAARFVPASKIKGPIREVNQ